MCGIIGYTGVNDAGKIIIEGLKALEYRGYDSAGLALETSAGVSVVRCGGRVSELEAKAKCHTDLAGNCGIGHTRWATHGAPTEANAHPHSSGSLCLVHNGIIDNYLDIKAMLSSEGYVFKSETDTECAAHLIDREYRASHNPCTALFSAMKQLGGSYALAIIFYDRPGEVWAVRRDNPLIAAIAPDGCYLASDIPAILPHSRDIYRPHDGEVLCLSRDGINIHHADGSVSEPVLEHIDWNVGAADREGYPHFMLKEIHEQPDAVRRAVAQRLASDGTPDLTCDGIPDDFWAGIDSISIIACGSATHAGLVGRNIIETLAGIPVTVNTASEYRYAPPAVSGRTLALAISQSGETADTLAALRLAKSKGYLTVAIVNAVGSAIAREADHVIYTHAGPEIAVATTKGYSTQVAVLAVIGALLALDRGCASRERIAAFCARLIGPLPVAMASIIERREQIAVYARKIYTHDDLYFIGRGPDFPAGTECSLKLKEISYIHSESYAAGELKHGTLSLVTEGTPVVALATDPLYFDKMAGNIREVTSRGGYVLLVCGDGFPHPEQYANDVFRIPDTDPLLSPLLSVVFAQLLAYDTALLRGCDVDHPRNLAKSVTVE